MFRSQIQKISSLKLITASKILCNLNIYNLSQFYPQSMKQTNRDKLLLTAKLQSQFPMIQYLIEKLNIVGEE